MLSWDEKRVHLSRVLMMQDRNKCGKCHHPSCFDGRPLTHDGSAFLACAPFSSVPQQTKGLDNIMTALKQPDPASDNFSVLLDSLHHFIRLSPIAWCCSQIILVTWWDAGDRQKIRQAEMITITDFNTVTTMLRKYIVVNWFTIPSTKYASTWYLVQQSGSLV